MKRHLLFALYIIYIACLIIAALASPPNPATLNHLHINVPEYHLAIILLLAPYIATAGAAFFASLKLWDYSIHLQGTPEGSAYRKLAEGIAVMAWGFMLPLALRIIVESLTGTYPIRTDLPHILVSYVTLVVPLAGFSLIGSGAHKLADIIKTHISLAGGRRFAILLIILGVSFTYCAMSAYCADESPYDVSLTLLIATIVIPYLYIWVVGLLGAYELLLYARETRGLLYKQALRWLAVGIAVVIIGSIALQFTTNLWTNDTRTSIAGIFIPAYGFIIIQAVGYGCIVRGSYKLNRIEEV